MNIFQNSSDIEIILLSAAVLLLIVQVIYHFGLYNNIYRHQRSRSNGNGSFSEELPPLSVIIGAHDESANLEKNLPAILEQDYPDFEVIVINDGSTDETDDVLKLLANKYSNLYHSFTPSGSHYLSRKKLALTLGIKAAKHNWLVFTEADCAPQSNRWLRLMARNFTPRTEIVLGYVGVEADAKKKNRIIPFDSLFSAMRYLGLAIAGHPYIGVGRNMAYRKELFYREKGYSRHLNLERGEDDLFVNQTATSINTRVETDPEAAVMVASATEGSNWSNEKLSYMSTARKLKGNQKYLLGAETLTRVLFFATVITGIVYGAAINAPLLYVAMPLLFILRWVSSAVVVSHTAKILGESNGHKFMLPLYEMALPIQTLFLKIRILCGYSGATRIASK